MKIRYELESDIKSIWAINASAFPTQAEANLVDALRSSADCISLVADIENEIVGHILFTPVSLVDSAGISIAGLAPMSVLSANQKTGIGSSLIQRGIEECVLKGYDAIVVLGHPDYYPKFGFIRSGNYGIKSEYDVPDDVFMIQELKLDALKHVKGVIKYHDAFNDV
jgi:putative acetyltransferase